jgi:hypothetical protein
VDADHYAQEEGGGGREECEIRRLSPSLISLSVCRCREDRHT